MISREELLNAIDECQEEPFTLSKCQKLADFVTVYEFFFEPKIPQQKTIVKTIIEADGDSEFCRAIDGQDAEKVIGELDKLMCVIQQLHPKMFNSFIEKMDK